MPQPGDLGNRVSNSPVLRFSAGARDCGLSLRRPGDERRSEVDAVARRGATRVRAASPIGVRVGDDVRGGGGVEGETEVHRATNIADDPLDRRPMRIPRGVHVKAHLLDSILQLGVSQGEVLQGTDDGAIR